MRKQAIDISQFRILGDVTVQKTAEGHIVTFPEEGGKLLLTGHPMQLGAVDWTGATHLVMEMTALEEFQVALVCHWASGANPQDPSAMFNSGVLPKLRVMHTFPLEALDSKRMFIPRTPGRGKQIVLGRGVSLEQVVALTITTKKCFKPQQILIHDIYLTWEEPEYIVGDTILVDSMGQLAIRDWPGRTHSEEEMIARLQAELCNDIDEHTYEGRSRYGGDLTTRWESTGYFRTQHDGKRWYLVDPEGYRFISTGVDCMAPGDEENYAGLEKLHDSMPDAEIYAEGYELNRPDDYFNGKYVKYPIINLMKAFGADWKQAWMQLTRQRMLQWHMNTIGNWSDPELIQTARLPYVWPLEGFPTTATCIFRDFPDVYSEEYAVSSKAYAEQLRRFQGDPYMIGYFLRNEPEWAFVQNLLIAEKVLENPERTCCKQVFLQQLQEKYIHIEQLNDAWHTELASWEDLQKPLYGLASRSEAARQDAQDFSVQMIRRYVALPSLACKEVDPDHLNLGMRYAILLDPILLEGAEYFDVFSINCYSDNPYDLVQQAGEITGKPVIIGEFHFGAIDAGMLSAGIRSVKTQRDRGLAYRAYYEYGMESPYLVGAHYFSLNDQAVLGRYDGENMQIGLVDVCQKPYEEFIREVTETNRSIYAIADGQRICHEEMIQRIPQIMGF